MNDKKKEAIVDLELSSFMPPPAGEAMVLGKDCPFGPETARRMLELVAPGDFECVKVDSAKIDSILIRNFLFKRINKDQLVKAIAEEAEQVMGRACMLSVKCNVRIGVMRNIDCV